MTQDQTQAQAQIETGVADTEPTIEELLAARDELDRRIKVAAKLQRASDLTACRKLISLHDFTARELGVTDSVGGGAAQADGERRPVPIKYRNPETGDTWTGRGLKPKWLQQALAEGKSLDDLLISSELDA